MSTSLWVCFEGRAGSGALGDELRHECIELGACTVMPVARFTEIEGAGHDCAGPELDALVAEFIAERT